ncbi:MAG: hypothetical protein WDO17_12150 [Alphaproteobacteria bacterium]
MLKILIAILAALSLAVISGTAAAATKKKVRHAAPAPAISAPGYPYSARTPGPVWASPNECYTDEGYGRYWPCGAGRGGD